jgi:hypothetical protein
MRLLSRIALGGLALGLVLTLDLGKALRTGDLTLNTASAKKHPHHKRHHRHHKKHHRARHRKHHDKQTEM